MGRQAKVKLLAHYGKKKIGYRRINNIITYIVFIGLLLLLTRSTMLSYNVLTHTHPYAFTRTLAQHGIITTA